MVCDPCATLVSNENTDNKDGPKVCLAVLIIQSVGRGRLSANESNLPAVVSGKLMEFVVNNDTTTLVWTKDAVDPRNEVIDVTPYHPIDLCYQIEDDKTTFEIKDLKGSFDLINSPG